MCASRPFPPFCAHPALLPPSSHPRPAGPKDYLNALLITLGCSLFLMTGSVKSKHAGADSSAFGLALMLGYLGFDGFTSTFQDKLFKGYQMTIYNQILCECGGLCVYVWEGGRLVFAVPARARSDCPLCFALGWRPAERGLCAPPACPPSATVPMGGAHRARTVSRW